MNEAERTVTVWEAAEILRVTERTIWNWLKKGTLKGFRQDGKSGKTMIHFSEIMPMLSEKDAERIHAAQSVPEGYMLIERQAWEDLQSERDRVIQWASEMGCRIGQLEAEKVQLQHSVKLLEDKRPWWKRMWR